MLDSLSPLSVFRDGFLLPLEDFGKVRVVDSLRLLMELLNRAPTCLLESQGPLNRLLSEREVTLKLIAGKRQRIARRVEPASAPILRQLGDVYLHPQQVADRVAVLTLVEPPNHRARPAISQCLACHNQGLGEVRQKLNLPRLVRLFRLLRGHFPRIRLGEHLLP